MLERKKGGADLCCEAQKGFIGFAMFINKSVPFFSQFGHDGVLNAGKIPSSDAIVGGGIWKENGVLRTYEWSGHYGMNWTPELREQFKTFMSSHGVSVIHTPGIAR